jgi:LysM repeat protein
MHERNGLDRPFLYLKDTAEPSLNPSISPTVHLSEAAIKRALRNAYPAVGFTLALLTSVALLYPRFVGAFWPLTGASAAEDGGEIILHDSNVNLLAAATNPDPNPYKGGSLMALSGDTALIASTGVEGTVAEPGGSGAGSISVYTVREGDSLSEIAEMFGVSMNTVLWANDLSSAGAVQPGMTLVILPVSGIRHAVLEGQTLSSIARRYDAEAEDVAAYNRLSVGDELVAGSEIIIPGGSIASPASSAKSSTASAKGSTSSKAKAPTKSTAAAKQLPSVSGFSNPVPGGRLSQGIHGYNGVDFSAPSGTPIYAAAGGSVVVAKGGGGYNGGYGNYIVVDHGNGTQTLYAHMSSLAVSGGSVSKGSVIGYVGNTGRSTGYHLHFEVRGATNPFSR